MKVNKCNLFHIETEVLRKMHRNVLKHASALRKNNGLGALRTDFIPSTNLGIFCRANDCPVQLSAQLLYIVYMK